MREALSRRRLIMVIVGAMLGMLLGALDQTIVGTAMPRIIAELNGLDNYAWTFTAYMLASTVTVPIYGKLSDIYGRRPFFLAGMVLFLVGSALAGTSQDITQLIVYRGVQGLGAGAMLPIVQAIVGDIFPPAERGKWQGIMMAVFGLASIVGPTAGGWITDNWGWRWVFYVNMPVGALAVVTAGFALPGQTRRQQHRIDYLGAANLVGGAVPMLLAFTWAGTQYEWGSPQIVGLLAGAAILFVAFVLIERRAAEPIISPDLFRNSIFSVSVIASFLISAGLFGAIMYLPLFVQGVIGDSATASGAVLTPMMLGFVASSIVGGLILSRTARYKVLSLVSFAIAAFGMFLLSRMDVTATDGLVIRNMIITGLGMGVLMGLFTIVVQNAFPFSLLGQVTASLQFFRSIGGTIGVAVLGTIMTNAFHSAFEQNMPQTLRQAVPPAQLALLQNPQVLLAPEAMAKLRQGFAAFGPQGQELFRQLMEATRLSLATAIVDVFTVGAAVVALAMLSCLFLREIPLRKSHSEDMAPEAAASDQNRPGRAIASAAGLQMRRVALVAVLALAAIALLVLVGLPHGTVIAQMEWRNGAAPKATVQWIADGGSGGGTADSANASAAQPQPGRGTAAAGEARTAATVPVDPSPPAPATAVADQRAVAVSPSPPPAAPNNGSTSSVSAAPAPPASAAPQPYVVKPGDTLSGIAARVYGDPNAWPRILAANAGQIPDPNLIRPGETLLLPAR